MTRPAPHVTPRSSFCSVIMVRPTAARPQGRPGLLRNEGEAHSSRYGSEIRSRQSNPRALVITALNYDLAVELWAGRSETRPYDGRAATLAPGPGRGKDHSS
ncbi:hypothetical protein E2C01_008456 [Portunus trituberculatus]|uniref:Uncharacterized protein n=1 Tax=Portunus trituberculatus TaxID=210409 RepID=A0A5B7D4M5_PORTR|nr:hypothetical protein [Portunus trituberculatus]